MHFYRVPFDHFLTFSFVLKVLLEFPTKWHLLLLAINQRNHDSSLEIQRKGSKIEQQLIYLSPKKASILLCQRMGLLSLLKPIGMALFCLQIIMIVICLFLKNLVGWVIDHLTLSSSKRVINPLHKVHPDVFLQQSELIKMPGFCLQTYEFQTEDHAFVSLWRVRRECPLSKQADTDPEKQHPIIIQHGLLDCSISWFLHADKSKCLPYMLAAEGYDVWVGNNRGTKLTLKNSHLEGYWDYNFDHFVDYDQPAIINGVLRETGKQQFVYIGHSQGSAQFIASLGIHQKIREKVKCFIGMGTVIGLVGMNKDHNKAVCMVSKFKGCEFLSAIGFKTILILPSWFCKFTGVLIYTTSIYFKAFFKIVTMLCGNPRKNKIDVDRFGVIISHEPGGASIKNALHWIQMYRSGKFCRFDHGAKKNLEKYGSESPPDYDLSHLQKVDFNMYLFKGDMDAVLTPENHHLITSRVPSQKLTIIELEDYAHLDYVWGIEAHKHIYDPIITILNEELGKSETSTSEVENVES